MFNRSILQFKKNKPPSLSLPSLLLLCYTLSSLSQAANAKKTIPSTTQQIIYSYSTPQTAWNPSPNINEDGFLKEEYIRIAGEWEVDANIGGKYG